MKQQNDILLKGNENDRSELVTMKFKIFFLIVFVIECAPNGTYIGLINFSKNKIIDLSKWFVTQYIDTKIKILYKIPDGIQLEPGGELRIYTKLIENITTSGITPYRTLINTEINSWGNY
jgi:hypothetical protein